MKQNKHNERLDETRLRLSSFVTFLMGFSQAVLIYVMSSYFELATGMQNVGVFYAFSYGIFLLILLNLHKLVRLWGKSNVFYFSLLANIVVITLLIFAQPSMIGVALLMLYIILGHIEWVALDVIVESFSVDRMSGRIRGLHLTILNAGFMFGPFASTYILDRMDFQGIFIFALIFNCFVFIFALIGFRNINHKFEQKLKVMDILRKVRRQADIMRIYYISFVLEFFYALMIIYTPIYLRNLGYSWENIGWIFTAMLAPFVVLQYPMGILADKKTGEKEFLIVALLLMACSTSAIYFIGTGTATIWAIVLFATRIGAALIEILRDSYFFKKIDAADVDLINFFRTSVPAANIMAAALSSVVLIFAPIKFTFILTGLVVLSALYPAFKLVDNASEKEMRAKATARV
ncbi:MAG: MFS transporter [Candidatus Moranbacteria bacterium]|nr:MFS transporter [Candidatus Moranbacteria bacterium]